MVNRGSVITVQSLFVCQDENQSSLVSHLGASKVFQDESLEPHQLGELLERRRLQWRHPVLSRRRRSRIARVLFFQPRGQKLVELHERNDKHYTTDRLYGNR